MNFQAFEQAEIIDEKENLLKFCSDPDYTNFIPGLAALKSELEVMRIEGCLTFPWQLRKLQDR